MEFPQILKSRLKECKGRARTAGGWLLLLDRRNSEVSFISRVANGKALTHSNYLLTREIIFYEVECT